EEAAGAAFRAYEPFLRMVVRRNLTGRLRAKFDSEDVVVSVWADLLGGFRSGRWQFADAAHLRAFLLRVTHNRFLNRLRRHRRAAPAGPVTAVVQEMAAAWRAGRPAPAEEFLARHPALGDDPEAAVRVIYEEICLRQEAGRPPATSELLGRFPRYRRELELLLD